MNGHEFVVNIRIILFLQMVVITLYHGKVMSGRLKFLSIWRTLLKPLLPNISTEAQKGKNRFWEIDMSKF